MTKLQFEPSDFQEYYYHHNMDPHIKAANGFNAKLAEIKKAWLDEIKDDSFIVSSERHSDGFNYEWRLISEPSHTHIACLPICFIEEIKPKECEHEPLLLEYPDTDCPTAWLDNECKHCGVRLRARWEVAEPEWHKTAAIDPE